MARIKKFFGLKTIIYCDRCHKPILSDPDVLCRSCFLVSPRGIRRYQTELSYVLKHEGLTCALCKNKFPETEFNHLCYSCISQHEDETHSGWSLTNDFDEGTVLHRHCNSCGALAIMTTGPSPSFKYYKVGSKIPTDQTFACSNNSAWRNQGSCRHDWLIIDSDVKPSAEGMKKYDEYRNNPGFQIMGLEHDEIEHLAYGSTKYWCHKCGLFYNLSPQKEKLLPVTGTIQ